MASRNDELHEYLALSVSGVQQFISDCRSTGDVWAASQLMSEVSRDLIDELKDRGADILIPAAAAAGTPNHIWVSVPAGDAAKIARDSADAVANTWTGRIQGRNEESAQADGYAFPKVRWVVVSAAEYKDAWRRATTLMQGRKRLRDFSVYRGRGGPLCSNCARREAHGLPAARLRKGEHLCPVCVMKRNHASGQRFPSTSSIASAPFRWAVTANLLPKHGSKFGPLLNAISSSIAALKGKARSVPATGDQFDEMNTARNQGLREAAADYLRQDGSWSYVEDWDMDALTREYPELVEADIRDIVESGASAARDIVKAAGTAPTPYLATVMQDGDDMGMTLSGVLDPFGEENDAAAGLQPDWHGRLSQKLSDAADGYKPLIDQGLGRLIYSGGDDLLAMLPVVHAVGVAAACRYAFAQILPKATASTAVVFFHRSHSLRHALLRSRTALDEAKQTPGKNAVRMVLLRRGGERAAATLRWGTKPGAGNTMSSLTDWFRRSEPPRLSARVIYDLERVTGLLMDDQGTLHSVGEERALAEFRRLVSRHSHGDAAGQAAVMKTVFDCFELAGSPQSWLGALHVARFVAQEAR